MADIKVEEKNIENKPCFEKINKYTVAIASLKNQLKNAESIDTLTSLAGKIIELENQIIIERTVGYKYLEKERKEIEDKIDKIRRELRRAEEELRRVDNQLDHKVNGYKKLLQNRIDNLGNEYNILAKQLSLTTD
jgi:septal ring factor EnvC (AmiA/AmiB activator)